MRRVVSPVGHLKLLQTREQGWASVSQVLPCPRLFRGPHKVLYSGYIESGKGWQIVFDPLDGRFGSLTVMCALYILDRVPHVVTGPTDYVWRQRSAI